MDSYEEWFANQHASCVLVPVLLVLVRTATHNDTSRYSGVFIRLLVDADEYTGEDTNLK